VQAGRPLALVVDDSRVMREALAQDLTELGYEVRTAVDGAEAMRAVTAAQPDLVVSDVAMPGLDGIGLCRALKNDPSLRFIPVVLMTSEPDRETHLRAIAAGADDFFGKPFDHAELAARADVLVRARVLNRALDGTENVVRALATVTAARSPAIIARALRIARLARLLAVAHGFPQPEADLLYSAGMLLDIGMITLPDAILLKSSPLTSEEVTIVRGHPLEGERICRSLQSLAFALPMIRHHHERYDGAGYPDGLAGSDIPLGARITAVADAWDALTHERPYRPQRSPSQAAQVLREGAGTQWDPAYVDVLLELHGQGVFDDDASAGASALPQ
jgi:putative two-component system response regulator